MYQCLVHSAFVMYQCSEFELLHALLACLSSILNLSSSGLKFSYLLGDGSLVTLGHILGILLIINARFGI